MVSFTVFQAGSAKVPTTNAIPGPKKHIEFNSTGCAFSNKPIQFATQSCSLVYFPPSLKFHLICIAPDFSPANGSYPANMAGAVPELNGYLISRENIPIGSMYAIYGNIDPITIPPLC